GQRRAAVAVVDPARLDGAATLAGEDFARRYGVADDAVPAVISGDLTRQVDHRRLRDAVGAVLWRGDHAVLGGNVYQAPTRLSADLLAEHLAHCGAAHQED